LASASTQTPKLDSRLRGNDEIDIEQVLRASR